MRRFIALFVLLALSSAAYCAPPREDSVDTLLTVTKAEKLLDTMFENAEQAMRQSISASVQSERLTAEQRRVLDASPAKFAKILREEMAWDKMHPLYVQIYQETFTQEEIDGLIAFYKSPTGAAFVEKMPIVMQKSMTLAQARLGPMMERMNAAIQQAIAEAKAAK